jgi:UDP-N-acetylglucosamine:LPS N-acetylglucosamine transferase
LAVASGGGHWMQLRVLSPAFEGHDVHYVTVDPTAKSELPSHANIHVVRDANRWNRWDLAVCLLQLTVVVLRVRPDVVVSTGAAPGYLAMLLGKWVGARAIWIDSIANVDELSMSGRLAGKIADLWLTQWEHLAKDDGPLFRGAIL